MLAAGFALLSCVKSEQQVSVGGTEVQDGSMDYILAAGPGAPVKTIVDNGTKVLWTDGDQIGMCAGNSATSLYNAILAEPSAQARFGRISDTKPVKDGDLYHAVYPSSAVISWGVQENAEDDSAPFCYVNIPKQQTAVKGSWDAKAAILAASSSTEQFAFRHAVSYIRFETTEQTGAFVAARLSAVNGEKLSDSKAGVKYLTSTELQIIPSTTAEPYVGLSNTESGTVIETGVYYLALLPGEYSKGLKLTFTNAENKSAEKTIGALTLKPGEVADWGTIGELAFGEAVTPLEKLSIVDVDGVKGVVFWVDEAKPNIGKIISGAGVQIKWGTASATTYSWATDIDTDNGAANHEFVLNVAGSNAATYPAVYYCNNLGDGWRLPTVNEIKELVKTYYGIAGELEEGATYFGKEPYSKNAADFDAILATIATDDPKTADIDETKITMAGTTWYWSGQGSSSNSKIWRVKVNSGYATGSANAKNDGYVRCIREITNK